MCNCSSSCSAKSVQRNIQQAILNPQDSIKTGTLNITGMSCAGCSSHIHSELAKTKGIISNVIQYPRDTGIISYNAAKISEKEIIAIIAKAGYKAVVIKNKR